jgi:hypothetical protein
MRVSDRKIIGLYQSHNMIAGVRLRGTLYIAPPDNIKMRAQRGIKPIPFPLLSYRFVEVIIRFLKGINS